MQYSKFLVNSYFGVVLEALWFSYPDWGKIFNHDYEWWEIIMIDSMIVNHDSFHDWKIDNWINNHKWINHDWK